MATYQKPDQNLTFNLPDEGQTFRATGDANGDAVYKIVNGQLTTVYSPTYKANTRFRDKSTGTVYEAGQVSSNPGDVEWLDPSYRGTATSRANAYEAYRLGTGQDAMSLPEYNMADFNTALGLMKQYNQAYPVAGGSAAAPIDQSLANGGGKNPNAVGQNGQFVPAPGAQPSNNAPAAGGASANGNYREGDYVPGLGTLMPDGSYKPTQAGDTGTSTIGTGTATPASPVAPPAITGNLGPDSTGAEVAALQQWLMSQGYSIPSLKSGAAKPGFYGPETQAAVTQWQKDQEAKGAMKIPDPSQYGFFGPLSRQAMAAGAGSGSGTGGLGTGDGAGAGALGSDLESTIKALRTAYGLPERDPNKTMVQQAMDDYGQIYKSLGIPSIKQSYTDAVDEFARIQNELNEKVGKIRDDPWLSQGIADRKVERLTTSYSSKLEVATNKMQLFDSMVKEGIAQANDIVGYVHQMQTDNATAVNNAIEIVQKRIDAENKLDTQVVDVGGRKKLIDSKTGDTIADLGASSTGSGGGSSSKTETERREAGLASYKDAFVPGALLPDGTPIIDNNSFINPLAWRAAIDDYPGSRIDFIKEYGHLLYLEDGKISPAYGLTPIEVKLITGEL